MINDLNIAFTKMYYPKLAKEGWLLWHNEDRSIGEYISVQEILYRTKDLKTTKVRFARSQDSYTVSGKKLISLFPIFVKVGSGKILEKLGYVFSPKVNRWELMDI